MAVSFLARDVSDLCLGKPPLRSLSTAATVADALAALKNTDESFISVWLCCEHEKEQELCRCVGKVCMVDVICYLSKEDNLLSPSSALNQPISVILPKDCSLVVHLQPSSRCFPFSLSIFNMNMETLSYYYSFNQFYYWRIF